MTEQTDPIAALTTYELVSIDAAAGLAFVRFENPYYSGAHITAEPQPILDEDGEPTGAHQMVEIDRDPNPHAVKHVAVPLTTAGQVDHDALVERLNDQARGVRARMDAARARQLASSSLESLVGFSTPST